MLTDKDKERIDAARARNITRTNRFLDARQRTIGLDLEVLDQQMRDRRAREEKEKVGYLLCFYPASPSRARVCVSLSSEPTIVVGEPKLVLNGCHRPHVQLPRATKDGCR